MKGFIVMSGCVYEGYMLDTKTVFATKRAAVAFINANRGPLDDYPNLKVNSFTKRHDLDGPVVYQYMISHADAIRIVPVEFHAKA